MEITQIRKFQELPVELRQRVFELALPLHGPRVLGTHFIYHEDHPEHSTVDISTQALYRQFVLDIALVSQEAREAVRRVYRNYHAGVLAIVAGETKGLSMPIQFNPTIDTLFMVGRYLNIDCPVPSCTCLSSMRADPNISLAVPFSSLVRTEPRSEKRDEELRTLFKSLTTRKHCTIVILDTRWAMSGDPRIGKGTFDVDAEHHVLIDIRNTSKLDQYKSKKLRRWSSHTSGDSNGAQTAERDIAAVLHHVKTSWLEINGCFEPLQSGADKKMVKWAARPPNPIGEPTSWDKLEWKNWDYEDLIAKEWVEKLPEFTVAVLVPAPLPGK
ncbi:hypothetical protein N0V93_005498 [Gnomoniopsis smithogilvyi]|uniref:2EXR domain-containing protein n=1 Tax=Gnomoniopsis smithogilvyi TaxID=1191159 RepID=A0A9W9CX68_9PEZI|nr:hypothetical protein N0V93_005498 [Gnomoniopsis smithogilvyi]